MERYIERYIGLDVHAASCTADGARNGAAGLQEAPEASRLGG